MEPNIEFKTFEFKVDKVDDSGHIEGYASTFGNVDLGLDVVKKGAFKKSIKETKGILPILFNHRQDEQIGWNEKAREDDVGLWVAGKLDLNIQRAKERYSLAKSALELGAPSGLSIGYATIKWGLDRVNTNVRNLEELKLYEYSLVTFPMNEAAFITAAKGFNLVDKAKSLITELKRQGISIKDFEIALKEEAYKKDFDPMRVGKALDDLINKFKS